MQIEKIAKTVNIAIDEALKELNTTIDKIDYEIIQEPSNGFLGLFKKPAKVLITLKTEIEIPSMKSSIKKIPKMVTEFEPKRNYNDKKNERKLKPINENSIEVAQSFLKEVFEKMKITVEIDSKLDERNHLLIKLKGKDIGIIIGKRGQTLDSLQHLINLVVNKGEFAYTAITLDTEDYRDKRRQTLENLAINLSKKVKKLNKSVSLEPMNPYERRIIHSKLQNDKSIKTYSEGEEPFRYVVIAPK